MVMVEPTDVALSTAWPRGNQRAQQAGAGVLHQIEHGLEARLAAVVRVRHIAGAVAGAEVGQAPQLVRMLGRAQGAGGALVAASITSTQSKSSKSCRDSLRARWPLRS